MLDAAGRLGLSEAIVDEMFEGAPLDFPIVFAPHLPLLSDRLGMAGITLGGRVWLLARHYAPEALIVLVRHEAEHVRQQRTHPGLFYPRYGIGWLARLLRRSPGATCGLPRWRAAYLSIPYELEAYAADERARRILARELRWR